MIIMYKYWILNLLCLFTSPGKLYKKKEGTLYAHKGFLPTIT